MAYSIRMRYVCVFFVSFQKRKKTASLLWFLSDRVQLSPRVCHSIRCDIYLHWIILLFHQWILNVTVVLLREGPRLFKLNANGIYRKVCENKDSRSSRSSSRDKSPNNDSHKHAERNTKVCMCALITCRELLLLNRAWIYFHIQL